ncbi:MAG: hypothetical protein AAGN66_29955 [Acidobacteriota bacterium]
MPLQNLSSKSRFVPRALAVAAIFALAMGVATLATATCSGTMYIYYETAAMVNETGAKLVCPGGVYYDTGPDGSFQATPYFVTVVMQCPCTGGGGDLGDPNDAGPDDE